MRVTDTPVYVNPYPGPWRRRRDAMRAPLPRFLGQFAAKDTRHRFRPLGPTLGSPQCAGCFGWFNDPRHP